MSTDADIARPHIVVGVDGSSESVRATAWAAEQARATGGHRGRGGIPVVGRSGIHYGRDPARQRRHVHGLGRQGLGTSWLGPCAQALKKGQLSRQAVPAMRQLRVQGSRRGRVHIKYAPCRYQRVAAGPYAIGRVFIIFPDWVFPKGHHNNEYC